MDGCIYRTADGKCEFWSDYGKGIVSYCDFEDCEEKKPSNADRIRSMTDEELSGFLSSITNCFNKCPTGYYCTPNNCRMFDWLRQEAE